MSSRWPLLFGIVWLTMSLASSELRAQDYWATSSSKRVAQKIDLPAPTVQTNLSLVPSEQTPVSRFQVESIQRSRVQVGPTQKLVEWNSERLGHRRLLFEEPQLERFGATRTQPAQAIVSGAKFFTRSTWFPLSWALGPHLQCEHKR